MAKLKSKRRPRWRFFRVRTRSWKRYEGGGYEVPSKTA
jgi:hypothetical protein